MSLFGRKTESHAVEPPPPTREGIVWKGAISLHAFLVALSELKLDERNARRHPERNIEAVKVSLSMFGQRKPIVTHGGTVLAGNGTLTAALALNWTHLAVVDASDLTKEQALAYSVADNKTAELAEWDFEELAAAFRSMPEDLLAATGFADFEIGPLLQSEWQPAPTGNGDGEGHADMTSIPVTQEQLRIIKMAIDKVKRDEGELSDGRALELICANFLA